MWAIVRCARRLMLYFADQAKTGVDTRTATANSGRSDRYGGDRVTSKPALPIHDMDENHLGLTKLVAGANLEAARVCLDRHHESPTDFDLERSGTRSEAVVEWQRSDPRTLRTWANETEATEAGALACALAAVDLLDGLVAVQRAENRKGVDYYVAKRGTRPDDLEKCLGLEISGVDRGLERCVKYRLKEKLRQAERGECDLPALAAVVGFKVCLIAIAELADFQR